MASVVTFAQLPKEEPPFLAYLAKTGDVWALAALDDPREPMPVADFLERYAAEIRIYNCVPIFLGLKPDVLAPMLSPVKRDGKEVLTVDYHNSCLVYYKRGELHTDGRTLNASNLCFYSSFVNDADQWQRKPDSFLRWAGKVLSWMRRNTPEQVRKHRANYSIRATAGVAARKGLKVV
jgi:hypothetical protein